MRAALANEIRQALRELNTRISNAQAERNKPRGTYYRHSPYHYRDGYYLKKAEALENNETEIPIPGFSLSPPSSLDGFLKAWPLRCIRCSGESALPVF